MAEPAVAQEPQSVEALKFSCENCGAQLLYDATKQRMKCDHCGTEQDIPREAGQLAIQEHDLADFRHVSAPRGMGVATAEYACSDCGASVVVPAGEKTGSCPFCGAAGVLAKPAAEEILTPESLVPFKMDRSAATQRFSKWLHSLWFRPGDLKKLADVHEIGGVYVPYWTFDSSVASTWTAQAGDYDYVTESYTAYENGKSVRRTRQVRKVRWEPASGRRSDFYDDLLVCASKGLPHELVDKFQTFNTKELQPYAPAFLAGWRCERYAVDLQQGWQIGREKISKTQYQRCGKDVPGDTHRFLSVSNNYSNTTFKHVLLPVWIAAYRYKKKIFRFLVNGQTGEVVGKAPWSVAKITLLVLFILAVVGGIIGYVQYTKSQEQQQIPVYPTQVYAPGQAQPVPVQPMPIQPVPVQPTGP
jgi:DNA-directed RNA polymerase subunit RPC12/RpoP